MTNIELDGIIKVCNIHQERLQYAIQQISHHFPFTKESFSQLTLAETPLLELFSSRFTKLQDSIGAKLFPLILELTGEQPQTDTFIDKVNRLEKIGALSSSALWMELRQARNHLAQEYPDQPAIAAQYLNRAFELAHQLLMIYQQLKIFISSFQARHP
jgi:hypothetical protein